MPRETAQIDDVSTWLPPSLDTPWQNVFFEYINHEHGGSNGNFIFPNDLHNQMCCHTNKLFTMTRYGDWPPVAHAYPCTEVTVMGNNELTLWCQLISVDVSTRRAISDGVLCTHMFPSNSCDKKNPMIAIYQKVSMAITTAVPKFSESTLCFIINLRVLAHKWTHSWRD